MTTLADFCSQLRIAPRAGASDADLATFERDTGLSLPQELRGFYKTSNGLDIVDRSGVEFLPLDSVRQYTQHVRGMTYDFGYFPFTEANDSNPFCVCCTSPLNGRVVHLYHDDSPVLKFRSLGSLLTALETGINEVGHRAYFRIASPDFDGDYRARAPRTSEDIRDGLALLDHGRRTDVEFDHYERLNLLRFGMRLVTEQQVGDVIALLDDNHDVREEAMSRLQQMNTPAAVEAVRRSKAAVAAFVKQAVAAMRAAGLNVAEVQGTNVRLDSPLVWMSMDVFFDERNRPDVFDFVVERARYFQSRKS